jgi:hypothetical protein
MSAKLQVPPGSVFGRLTVVGDADSRRLPSGQTRRAVICECTCGNRATVLLDNLRRGLTNSCGCGEVENRIKHGLHEHPLYRIWVGMHSRCRTHPDYAGRGISVHEVWHGEDGLRRFISWAEANGHHPGLEIDRENNDGDYEPNNCRFVTRAINQRNKRGALSFVDPSTQKIVSLMSYWEKYHHPLVDFVTARSRIKYYGWDMVRAVTTPPYADHIGHANRKNAQ